MFPGLFWQGFPLYDSLSLLYVPLIALCLLPQWFVLLLTGVAESEEYQITLSSHADMKANVLVTENGQIVKEEREESDTKKTFFTAKLIAPGKSCA